MTILTHEILDAMGFRCLMQDNSYSIELENNHFPKSDEIPEIYSYREISVSKCNDKGKGEWYVFLREGETFRRSEDEIVTLTRTLLYKEDLEVIVRLSKNKL